MDNIGSIEPEAPNAALNYDATVNEYYQALYKFAIGLTGSANDAADLTQETFRVLLLKGGQIRNPQKIKSWLFTTLYREFLSQRRHAQRFPEVEMDVANDDLPIIVEHGIIRAHYHDARLHFVLVCAARGCPPLRVEAYVAARLEQQLNHQGRVFFGQTQKNRVEVGARVLFLSPIFKWFSEDFEKQSGSVLKFVEPFLSETDRRALAGGGFKIKYTDYDWSLNDQAQK